MDKTSSDYLAGANLCRPLHALQVMALAAMLVGCGTLPATLRSAIAPEKDSPKAQTLSPEPIGKGDSAAASTSAGMRTTSEGSIGSTPKEDAEVRTTKPFVLTVNEVKAMLVRADPGACSVLNDAGAAQIAATYAKLANVIGTDALQSASTAELQAKLNTAKPLLREISVNTNWLPRAAERLVANYLYKREFKNDKEYEPKDKVHQKFMRDTFHPIFEELRRYASIELKSDMPFQYRKTGDENVNTLRNFGGGIILVPKGFIGFTASKPNADQLVAVQLAHEFAHILRAHYTKLGQLSLIGGITDAKEFKKLTKDAQFGVRGITDLSQMFSFSESNVNSLMSHVCRAEQWMPSMQQDQEFEGDVCGVMLLRELSKARGSKFNPVVGFREYIDSKSVVPNKGAKQKLLAKSNNACTVKTIHPAPAERLEKIEAYHRSLTEEASR